MASSRVSSGQNGYETPTGIFSIIQKKRRHFSNIYHGASMPFMQRLTWSGIALHEGKVPNYRASHGCVRLPRGFAGSLFSRTERRSHVVIADGNPRPRMITHDFLFQPIADATKAPETDDGTEPQAVHSRYVRELPRPVRIAMSLDETHSHTSDVGNARILTQARTEDGNKTANVFEAFDQLNLDAHRRMTRATRSTAPLRILITRRSTRERIREMQRLLIKLGYEPGLPDGYIGAQTRAAIKAFQAIGERPVTGRTDAQFYRDLYLHSGRRVEHHAFIHIRQKTKDIYSAPVELKSPGLPLGTHLFVLSGFDNNGRKARWSGMTVKNTGRVPVGAVPAGLQTTNARPMTPGGALDRIALPDHVRRYVEDLVTRGSSLIVSDGGHTRETGIDTDFIVLTK
ncbi:MAG: peptidoglycan-binding protein [Hyphomicrobiaceae bacterium]